MSDKPTVSLMRQPGETNPRYTAEAAELAALKGTSGPEGQPEENTPSEQQPVHDWEKRYKDLQSYHSKTVNQHKAEVAALRDDKTPKFIAPKTAEEMAEFKVQNPETYAFIQSIANDIADTKLAQVESQFNEVSHDLMQTRINEAALAVKAAHPDFEAIRDSQEFHEWGARQDDVIKGWLYDNPDNAQNAIRAISIFKAESGWGTQASQEPTNTNAQPNAAQHVDVRGNTQLPMESDRNHPAYIWKDSEIASMRPQEYGQWAEVINLAVREGRYAQGQ